MNFLIQHEACRYNSNVAEMLRDLGRNKSNQSRTVGHSVNSTLTNLFNIAPTFEDFVNLRNKMEHNNNSDEENKDDFEVEKIVDRRLDEGGNVCATWGNHIECSRYHYHAITSYNYCLI